MANYYSTTRTNYFRVTDEVKYAALFERLTGGESEVFDFTRTDENGNTWHGFGAYDMINYIVPLYDNDDESYDEEEDDYDEEYDFDQFLDELQTILPDGEAFIMFNAGNEKLRYVCGNAIVVTNTKIEVLNLKNLAVAKAAEMLGNKDFETQCEY